jgi:hypothetical protein
MGAAGVAGAGGGVGAPGGRIAGVELAGACVAAGGGRGGAIGLVLGGIGIDGTPDRAPASGGRSGFALPGDCSGGAIGIPPPAGELDGADPSTAGLAASFTFGVSGSAAAGASGAGAGSSTGFGAAAFAFFAAGFSGSAPLPIRWRTCSATSSSSELECVFLSSTPSSGRRSIIKLGLTSSSLASSLMRILLMSPVRFGLHWRRAAPLHSYAHLTCYSPREISARREKTERDASNRISRIPSIVSDSL